jgi:hypothetical protein
VVRGWSLVRVRSCNTPRPRLPPRLRAALERSRTHAKLQAQVERCKEVLREAQATLHRYAEARYVHRRVSRLCATAIGVRKVKRVIKRRERFAEVLAKSRRQLEQEHEIHRRPAAYDTLRHDGVLNFISVPRRAPPGGSY